MKDSKDDCDDKRKNSSRNHNHNNNNRKSHSISSSKSNLFFIFVGMVLTILFFMSSPWSSSFLQGKDVSYGVQGSNVVISSPINQDIAVSLPTFTNSSNNNNITNILSPTINPSNDKSTITASTSNSTFSSSKLS